MSRRNPIVKRRDAIVESVYLAHPEWTSARVFEAVAPLIETAGLPPVGINSLREQLRLLAKKHKMKRARGGMHPKYAAYLREEFDRDETQEPKAVWAKFRAVWGPEVESPNRVMQWWASALCYLRRKKVAAAGRQAPSGVSSPPHSLPTEPCSDPDLPPNWWELDDDLIQYLNFDSPPSSIAAGIPTTDRSPIHQPGSSLGGRRVLRYLPPAELKRRNAIVESMFLANPTWTISKIYRAANPLIQAAGFTPITFRNTAKIIRNFAKAHNMRITHAGMRVEYTTFLKELFAEDPNQPVREVVAKFTGAFGQDAEKEDRVTSWWRSCRSRALEKQMSNKDPATTRGSPAGPPASRISTRPHSPSLLSVERAPSVTPNPHQGVPTDLEVQLPLDWWDLGGELASPENRLSKQFTA